MALKAAFVGTSITASDDSSGGCRVQLALDAAADRLGGWDFVGDVATRNPPAYPTLRHCGYPGEKCEQIEARVAGWTFDAPSYVVLMDGAVTNNLQIGESAATALARAVSLVNALVAKYPLAEIMWFGVCSGTYAGSGNIATINRASPAEALAMRAAGKRVTWWEGLSRLANDASELSDGTHPNATGYAHGKDEIARAFRSKKGIA